MRRLSTMIKPMHMEWKDIGCSYNTSAGMRTVLQVGPPMQSATPIAVCGAEQGFPCCFLHDKARHMLVARCVITHSRHARHSWGSLYEMLSVLLFWLPILLALALLYFLCCRACSMCGARPSLVTWLPSWAPQAQASPLLWTSWLAARALAT